MANLPEQHSNATQHLSDVAGAARTPSGVANPSQLPPNPGGNANHLTGRESNLEKRAEQTISDRNASIQKGNAAGRARRARLAPKK